MVNAPVECLPVRRAPFIDGDFRSSTTGGRLTKINPATGEALADVLVAGSAEIDDAFASAVDAQPGWAARSATERAETLAGLARAIRADAVTLGKLGTAESGVPSRVSEAMAARSADFLDYYADGVRTWLAAPPGDDDAPPDQVAFVPYGVIGVLPSWNGHSGIWRKCAPALAAGNCVVLKPSELAPFAALQYAEIAQQVGLPPGVLNVVPGGPSTGQLVAGHPLVDKISFTGGRPAAAAVMATAARRTRPVLLELGGKSAAVVFADADLQRVAREVTISGLALSGQGCVNPTRLLVERRALPTVLDVVTQTARALRVGDPTDEATDLGPLITAAARDRVLQWVSRCRDAGWGRVAIPPADQDVALGVGGFFVAPTVITDVDIASPIAQEEIFGPVLCLSAFDTEEEAIDMANATDYGLSGYVFSGDVERARRVASRLLVGAASINRVGPIPPQLPFGGMKGSGFGREGGRAGLAEYLQAQVRYEHDVEDGARL